MARPDARFPIQFPKYYAPATEALEYKAGPELLLAEMRSQIGNFALALDAARAALLLYKKDTPALAEASKIDEDAREG